MSVGTMEIVQGDVLAEGYRCNIVFHGDACGAGAHVAVHVSDGQGDGVG